VTNLTGKRIIVIDDEGAINLSLRQDCEQARMIVVGLAYNGKVGVEVALEQHPDIVLADIQMPVMDGLEAARSLLAQLPVCVVLLTSYADSTSSAKIAQLGVHGCVVKPVIPEDLIPALQDAYERFLQGKTIPMLSEHGQHVSRRDRDWSEDLSKGDIAVGYTSECVVRMRRGGEVEMG
jgi:CheY-like chemotaxis protein